MCYILPFSIPPMATRPPENALPVARWLSLSLWWLPCTPSWTTLWFLPYSVGLCFSFLGSLPSPVSLFLCCLLKAEKTKHMDFQHTPPVPCLFFFLCTCEPALSEEDLCGRVSCALWAASCGLGLLHYVHTKPACSPFLPFPVLREFLSKQKLPITCQF